jgi:hypothetical protein
MLLTEAQFTGGRDLETHLALDVGRIDTVALAERAGFEIHDVLRYDEERETLGAGTRAVRPR